MIFMPRGLGCLPAPKLHATQTAKKENRPIVLNSFSSTVSCCSLNSHFGCTTVVSNSTRDQAWGDMIRSELWKRQRSTFKTDRCDFMSITEFGKLAFKGGHSDSALQYHRILE